MDTRSEIRDFLTSRRGRITPEDAGLKVFGPRRVPGLRREEVATLAGLSVDYYNRLERGNLAGASDLVLDALADALRLDAAERAHLLDPARASQPTSRARRRSPTQTLRPSIQWMLDAMTGSPAFAENGRLDALAANRLGGALYPAVFSHARQPGKLGAVRLPPSRRPGLLRRLGPRRQGLRRHPPPGGRPEPSRPRALRPRRRARHQKPGVPRTLGRAQRSPAHHGHQAVQPPRRGRAGTQLQPARSQRRPGPDDRRLHRRARLAIFRGPSSTCQLGSNRRRRKRSRPARALSPRDRPRRPMTQGPRPAGPATTGVTL